MKIIRTQEELEVLLSNSKINAKEINFMASIFKAISTNHENCIFTKIKDCADAIALEIEGEKLYGFAFLDAIYRGYDLHFANQSHKFGDKIVMRLIDSLERRNLIF
tara:strand:- start:176 stop:493 length:318 start_codon:yes stop_codon:yes gene_type:complete